MVIILGLMAFGVVYWFLTKDTKPPPEPMTQDELLQEGLTKLQARRELRAQRQELRSHSSSVSQASRTANMLSKSVAKSVKKKKSW
jgi:hypothetical protein